MSPSPLSAAILAVARGCAVTAMAESSYQLFPQDQKMHRVTGCIPPDTPTSKDLLCMKPSRKTVQHRLSRTILICNRRSLQ
jgi:hypothetical protein